MEEVSFELTNVNRGNLFPLEDDTEVSLDLHNMDPNRPSNADLDLPAPWIYYKLVNQDRDRVLRIEVDPFRNRANQREVKYWTNNAEIPPKECLQLDLVWRVTFKNDEGEIETIERTLPMYTRIPRPPKDDAQAELETARRLTMVTKAYTYPVLASLDPHQKNEQLWKRVTEVCDTELFQAECESKDNSGKDTWKKWKIRYGPKYLQTIEGDKIDQRVQLLHRENVGWTTGAVVNRQQAVTEDKVLQASDRFAHLFDPPRFGEESDAVDALNRRPADELTISEIRRQGLNTPYRYLERLKSEIEHEQNCFSDLRKNMLVKTGQSSKTYKPSEEFEEFLELYGYGWKQWGLNWVMPKNWAYRFDEAFRGTLERVGLSQHSKRYQLEKISSNEQKLQAALRSAQERKKLFEDSIQGIPTEDEQQRMEQHANEVKQRETQLQQLEGTRLNLKKELQGPRRDWESRVAVLCTLQDQMQERLDHIKALLMKSVDADGWGLEDAHSLLTPDQKNEWHSYLQTMEERLQYQQTAIACAVGALRTVGIDFSSDQQAASIDSYLAGIPSLITEAHQYEGKVNPAIEGNQVGLCEYLQARGHELLERLHAEEQGLIHLQATARGEQTNLLKQAQDDATNAYHRVQRWVLQLHNYLQPNAD